jgi:hypothetical protein
VANSYAFQIKNLPKRGKHSSLFFIVAKHERRNIEQCYKMFVFLFVTDAPGKRAVGSVPMKPFLQQGKNTLAYFSWPSSMTKQR